jgi:hypothetical protein
MIYLWLQAKAVNSIVRHVAEILGYKTDQELEDLYRSLRFLSLIFAGRYDVVRVNPVFRILPLLVDFIK